MARRKTSEASNVKKIPVNRVNLWYDQACINYDIMMGKNYLEQDCNQTVILYEVDLENTNRDALYQETGKDEVRFKSPKELHVLYSIQPTELKSYKSNQGVGSYNKIGNLEFGVYQATLDEQECEIKKGDYIGVVISPTHMEYFTVVDDGKINFDNENTLYSVVAPFRKIVAVWADRNDFEGK